MLITNFYFKKKDWAQKFDSQIIEDLQNKRKYK